VILQQTVVIGGRYLGICDRDGISAQLIYLRTESRKSFVAVLLAFPMTGPSSATFYDTQLKPLDKWTVELKMTPGSFISSGRVLTPDETMKMPLSPDTDHTKQFGLITILCFLMVSLALELKLPDTPRYSHGHQRR
jgi:hypothetical protein